MQRLIVLSGCFWGSERALSAIPGVRTTTGYAGGSGNNPTYYNLASTRHSEAVLVEFDPDEASMAEVLEVAAVKSAYDPSPPSDQRYRRAVFCSTEAQAQAVRTLLARIAPGAFSVVIGDAFHEAEPYHQRYYDRVLGR